MTKHRSRIAAVLALLLLATTPALGDEYEEATRLLRQGRTAAALEKVDAAIASNRTDARPRFLKGLILTERNEIQAAIGVFTDLTRDFPSLPEPYNNLAVLYAAQGQYDQARQSLEMAIHTHPSYAVAHENLGDVYAKMASEAYDKALSLDRSNKTAKTKLSLIRELFSKAGSPVGPTTATAVNEAVPPPQPATTDVPRTRPSTPPPEAGPNQEAAVIAAVANWAQAWSEQDVGAYLSHYAADFIPPRGQSRDDWALLRDSRLRLPSFIRVEVTEPQVWFTGPGRAVVRFRQRYQSDTVISTGYKTLTMKKSNQRWLIAKEQFKKL